MIKLSLNGAFGRMGKTIIEVCLSDPEVKIVGLADILGGNKKFLEYPELPPVELSLEKYIEETDVIVDFSSPEGTQQLLQLCKNYKKPIVIGTTGHSDEQLEKIKESSLYIPIVLSPNMSLGVNLMFKLVDFITKTLSNKNYDIEIIEAHHNKKKDAPSGTAKKIMEIIKQNIQNVEFVFRKEGILGERKYNEVGINIIRAGDIVGEHLVIYSTYGERLEIKHTATSRQTFAKGAVLAAKWIFKKSQPGLYSMFDVLNI
ncbi:MAG: 4-hydroxy-tetrahydrodipicolinate reductase [Endomicrobia bacterium]|nr:4-hydroxy-tetrahydrodipicolinate reductase [Endomicrobiia bacterium]